MNSRIFLAMSCAFACACLFVGAQTKPPARPVPPPAAKILPATPQKGTATTGEPAAEIKASPAPAATPKADDVPQLKDSVAAAIWKDRAQLAEMQAQEAAIQSNFPRTQIAYQQHMATALKDSGIDETKFQVDPNTLAVTAKPPAPPAAEKKP